LQLLNKLNVCLFAAACLFMVSELMATETNLPSKDIQVVLIGASIGNSWKFNELPDRVGLENFKLEFIPVFDSFDKSPAISDILNRDALPDVVIIKECSVYFPGDVDAYKRKVIQWVGQLSEKQIDVVLATSVPISELTSFKSKVKSFLKSVFGKPDKMKQLTAYNDWLREYANQNDLGLLDLEAALRVSDEIRYMDPKYDRGDHVHLNQHAYKTLDQTAKSILLTVRRGYSEQ